MVMNTADRCINEGSAQPMIIVMPDAGGPNRGYRNLPDGQWNYEDFFFQEFLPYIEKTYRIRAERRYRYIAGLSMGGNGTFIYALHHPELFSAACPLSAATWPLTMEDARERLLKRFPDFSEARIEEFYNNHSIIELINAIPGERKNAVRWYIDCGDDDQLAMVYEGNSLIHIAMRKKGIPHEFRIRDGRHNWSYWRSALPEVLKFVSFRDNNS
jgi:enterochelin esterase-like enzyme